MPLPPRDAKTGKFLSKFELEDRASRGLLNLKWSFAELGKNIGLVALKTNPLSMGLSAIASAAGPLKSTFSSLASVVNPLAVGMGLLGSTMALGAISKVNSSYEDLQIGMAQTLKFMGMGGKNFQESMANAEITIQQVNAAAALLPGEAEDYAKAMQLAGATVAKATGDYDKSFNIIKNMVAIGESLRVDAGLTATMLNRMLDRNRGFLENTSDAANNIINAIRQLPGYASMTAAAFNKLKLEERVKIVEGLGDIYKDMIDASSNTMAAVQGASMTLVKTLTRQATSPLFDGMKASMSSINSSLMDTNGQLTELGQQVAGAGKLISIWIVKQFEHAANIAGRVAKVLIDAGNSPVFGAFIAQMDGLLSRWEQLASRTMESSLISSFMPSGPQQAAASSGAGADPMSLPGMSGNLLADAMPKFDLFTSALDGAAPILASLGEAANSATVYMAAAGGILNDTLGNLLGGLGSLLVSVAPPIIMLMSSLWQLGGAFLNYLRPAINMLTGALGHLIEAAGNFLGPALRILGGVVYEVYSALANFLAPVIDVAARMFSYLINGIASFLTWLGNLLGPLADRMQPQAVEQNQSLDRSETPGGFLADMLAKFQEMGSSQGGKGGGLGPMDQKVIPQTPESRGGGKVVQDFKFSRFDISQKFEEGFDPDRIAVAFAKDVGRMGEQALQSGFEPLFAVR
jgi:hypothetical protein